MPTNPENYFDKLEAEHLELQAQNRELQAALEAVLSHERGIVHLVNSFGEAAPAAFSLDCEQARSALAKARGQ